MYVCIYVRMCDLYVVLGGPEVPQVLDVTMIVKFVIQCRIWTNWNYFVSKDSHCIYWNLITPYIEARSESGRSLKLITCRLGTQSSIGRIDFRDDQHFSTAGYLGRSGRSLVRSPIARRCRARGPIARVCDRWQPSATGSTPTTQSVKEYPATLKRLRCSVFLYCPIGAIGSTYKSRKISKSLHTIFKKFSGFFALKDSSSHTKN